MPETPTLEYPHQRSAWIRAAESVRPPPDLTPSEFAARYRKLHPIYCSERPGSWDNTVFPYQPHTMDMVQEAIRTGKRGVVFMKGGQVGGTDMAINTMLWLKEYFPGPQLFMTSTEKVASEFGRERFGPIIEDCQPLRRKYLRNARGDILTKRFTDGKIQLCGGQSVNNLQSNPYRIVGIDELDSLVENLGGQGDPVRLAEVRTDSFVGQTLIIAYAHPSTKDRGAARLFYELSDQRRPFVRHGCGSEFWIDWAHVQCKGDANDPANYAYVCPHCGAVIEDAQRVAMIRQMQYRSVLPPEVAAKKTWIGAQFGQMLSPAKSLRSLAQRIIECGTDDNALRVFFNKVLGESHDPKIQRIDLTVLRALIAVKRRANDPEFYIRGQAPPWVRFLTAGQDSRNAEFHYAIWGWGLRKQTDGNTALCGCLIDWGCIQRATPGPVFSESEYHVFDDLIYRRVFGPNIPGSNRQYQVRLCGHDVGYAPTQIPIIRYCRNWTSRAAPTKGASLDATSACMAPYAQLGAALRFKAGEVEVKDATSSQLLMNTYVLKSEWYGWVNPDRRIEVMDQPLGARKVYRLSFPEDVDEEFVAQSGNEELVKGKRRNELVWVRRGANHYADCNTQAYGCAMYLDIFQGNSVVGETPQVRQRFRPFPEPRDDNPYRDYPRGDPSMG